MAMITPERQVEEALVTKLRDLKYEYRPDIHDQATLEANFRVKFEVLNRVTLTDGEFQRLLDEIVTPDVTRPPGPSGTGKRSSATTAHRSTTLSLTSRTGARTPSRSSISSASIRTAEPDPLVPTVG
jgi:hypothetical protein